MKGEAVAHYSKGLMECSKCHFKDIRALTLDLVDGGHKKKGLPYGTKLYEQLKKEGWPEGWQVLCFNCQWIKEWETNKW
jgi:hypothetical protein